jgi:hypothetical protein
MVRRVDSPWRMFSGPVIGVFVGVVVVLLVVVVVVTSRSLASPELEDDGCMACGCTVRHALGPGAYRCAECGYEGGPGWAALRDREQLQRHASLGPAERTRAVLGDLLHARVQLMTAVDRLAWLELEWALLVTELADEWIGPAGDPELPEIERPTLDALERIAEAERALADARLKLRSGPTSFDPPLEIPAFDGGDDPGSVLLLRARRAHRAAHGLLVQVDAILTRD